MNGKEQKAIREALGMSQWTLAGILGVSQVTISQRELDQKTIPQQSELLLRYMEKFGGPQKALGEG